MGVCPQFDVLWGELTGVEHLRLYGQVKVGSSQMGRRQRAPALVCGCVCFPSLPGLAPKVELLR